MGGGVGGDRRSGREWVDGEREWEETGGCGRARRKKKTKERRWSDAGVGGGERGGERKKRGKEICVFLYTGLLIGPSVKFFRMWVMNRQREYDF